MATVHIPVLSAGVSESNQDNKRRSKALFEAFLVIKELPSLEHLNEDQLTIELLREFGGFLTVHESETTPVSYTHLTLPTILRV